MAMTMFHRILFNMTLEICRFSFNFQGLETNEMDCRWVLPHLSKGQLSKETMVQDDKCPRDSYIAIAFQTA